MQNIIIHCKPSVLETVQQLNHTYRDYYDEVDVILPYDSKVEDINNSTSNDEEFVNHFGLDYEQVNCIELI
tara:strand:+ start:1095 stop:1307 length:213 start_codon:yes stop_codon:yes gene_type:complete